jgi:hypothetical protein
VILTRAASRSLLDRGLPRGDLVRPWPIRLRRVALSEDLAVMPTAMNLMSARRLPGTPATVSPGPPVREESSPCSSPSSAPAVEALRSLCWRRHGDGANSATGVAAIRGTPPVEKGTDAMTGFIDHGPDPGGRDDARLEFNTDPSIPTILDGAWWPRTRDSASELADLIGALDARHAAVDLIMLNPHGWLGHPCRVDLDGRTVQVEWTAGMDTAVVSVTAARNRRIDLLLVVPSTHRHAESAESAESDESDDAGRDGGRDGPHPGPQAPAAPRVPAIRQPGTAAPSPPRPLHTAIAATRLALARVGAGPPGRWVEGVLAALLMTREDLREHHDSADGPPASYRQVLATTPRLAHVVADLDREREGIGALVDRMLADIAQPAVVAQVDRVRTQILTLLQSLDRYQQHGSDLLHQADQLDLGGQG